jgi:nitrogenase subunit NifH
MTGEKVKILTAVFDKKRRIVIWTIQKIATSQIDVVAFRASDIGYAVGINKEIPDAAIVEFCKMLKNKVVNWVAKQDDVVLTEAERKEIIKELTEDKNKEIEKTTLSEKLDKKFDTISAYPIEEVQGLILERKKRTGR